MNETQLDRIEKQLERIEWILGEMQADVKFRFVLESREQDGMGWLNIDSFHTRLEAEKNMYYLITQNPDTEYRVTDLGKTLV